MVVPGRSRVQDEVQLVETVGLTRSNPDYYPLQVGMHVLTGAFYASRLYKDLREKSGLVYFVDSSLNAGKTRSNFGVYYGCDPRNVSRARLIIERDLMDMLTNPVDQADPSQAKNLLVHQLVLSQTGSRGIALKLLALSEIGLPLDEPFRAAGMYRKITAAQVKSAFSKWIRPAGFVQITTGPQPQ